jgi:sugar/nucleoside kinase (ribokinase family)
MVLVAGSIGIDRIILPNGTQQECIGGSAVHFAYAAALFGRVRMLGVVGEDFPPNVMADLAAHRIDTHGVEIAPGKTFRWTGKYLDDMDNRETLATELNVLGQWQPKVPDDWRDSRVLFLANGSPRVQRAVMEQIPTPDIVVCDTMDLWIKTDREELDTLFREVDGIFMNESEVSMYTHETSAIRGGELLLELGPEFIVIKKGAHGALLCTKEGVDALPAFPIARVHDPTGAGDSFAGGFLGYLGAAPSLRDRDTLKRALAYGMCVASFNVEDFGAARLARLREDELSKRFHDYTRMLAIR